MSEQVSSSIPRLNTLGFPACLLAILSTWCVLYFLFLYDISIPVETGDTVNLELMQNRELGVIVGLLGVYTFVPFALGHLSAFGGLLKGIPRMFKNAPRKYIAWTVFVVLVLWGYFYIIPDVVLAPPEARVAQAINWRLSSFIDGSGQLYESYKITRFRRFSSDSETWYVYDFSALCDVTGGVKTFSSRVALVKKDGFWQNYKGVDTISN